ncbi:MAG: hypothetical protein H6R18_372 [Proteobacteria bacterium]|nr:hypothetical protein [Pseudomonadota bacterium]
MAHGNAVVDGDGVEFLGDAAGRFDFAGNHLTQILQVYMPRHKLGEGIDHGNDGFAEIAFLDAGGAPEGASASHVAAMGGSAGAILGHGCSPGGIE